MLPPEVFVSVFSTLPAYSLCAVEFSSPLFAKIIEKNSNKLAKRRIIVRFGGQCYEPGHRHMIDYSSTLRCFDEHVRDVLFKYADEERLCCKINHARLQGRPIEEQLAMVLDRVHVRAVRCLDFIAPPGPEMLAFFRQFAAQDRPLLSIPIEQIEIGFRDNSIFGKPGKDPRDPSAVIDLAVNHLRTKQLSVFRNMGAFEPANRRLCGLVEQFTYHVYKRQFIDERHMELMFNAPGCQRLLYSFQCIDDFYDSPGIMRNYLYRIFMRFRQEPNAQNFAKNVLMYDDCMMWGSGDLALRQFLGQPTQTNVPMNLKEMLEGEEYAKWPYKCDVWEVENGPSGGQQILSIINKRHNPRKEKLQDENRLSLAVWLKLGKYEAPVDVASDLA